MVGLAPGRTLSPAVLSLLAEGLDALQHEGIQIVSPEWRYLYVNGAVARQGRKRPEELLGRTMHECYPGIERTAIFARLRRCMQERRPDELEDEFTFEDGERAWFELRIRPCPAGLLIASLDISARREVERRLKETYQQALRDLVTPVLRVAARVLLVPLIGALDTQRAAQATEAVLLRVADERARVVIFDVAGVPALDTSVAHDLLAAARMLRLLGAATVVTGISPEAASTLARLGVDLSCLLTAGTLAEGLTLALAGPGQRGPERKDPPCPRPNRTDRGSDRP